MSERYKYPPRPHRNQTTNLQPIHSFSNPLIMRPSTLLASGLASLPSLSLVSAAASTQQIALASYIHPLGDPDAWNRIVSYPSSKISVLVANVNNGPDTAVNSDWNDVISRSAATGKRVIGYVRTGYLGLSQQHMTTRLGSSSVADWIAQIESDVRTWYELYGDLIGGIFFDEGWNECGADNEYAHVYAYVNQWTKRTYPGAYTVINPGSPMPQCFEDAADTLLTFERGYEEYLNNYYPIDWVPTTDERKIWHIVYGVPVEQVASVAALAKERGAGFVHITDDGLDNPYDNLPQDGYMQTEMGAVSGGEPNVAGAAWPGTGEGAPGTPGGLAVVSAGSTSVTLSWSAVGGAYGYNVYVNGEEVLSVPASVTRTTVVGLAPRSALQFTVSGLGAGGEESPQSAAVSASTTSSRRTRSERRRRGISTK